MRTIPYEKSLEYCNPELSKEWHPVKNENLMPCDVTPGSSKKVWWYLPYDDPISGKHFEFEWQALVKSRARRNQKCPYLVGKAIYQGYNDLATKCPELAKEWHPVKNGDLTPRSITAGSKKEIWWYLPYDDPTSGKHFDFEWKESVVNRVLHNYGCPYLSGQKVWRGYNDLATLCPRVVKEWHPTKNGKLTISDVAYASNKEVWWYLPYDDPDSGRHFDFEWKTKISNRTVLNEGCPYLIGQKVWPGYNDLKTLYPELAQEWHPVKNGKLTPSNITAGSSKLVWWYLPYDDPISGKHFDFEWKAKVANRTKLKNGCPYLSGTAVWKGYNDLETLYPKLAREWHPVKNGKLTPSNITAGSSKLVWWYLPYDDPINGKHFDFEWKAPVANRTKLKYGCPYLTGTRVWPGYNDLETLYPKLAREWHPVKN